jgi:hypothetical protein
MKNILTIFMICLLAATNILAYNLPETPLILTKVDSVGIEEKNEDSEDLLTGSRLAHSFNTKSNNTFSLSKYRTLQDDVLFTSDKISVKKIYPNPASAMAYLDYRMIEDIQAKITVRNLLGKVIKEYDLEPNERQIKIPTMKFEAGIYFYTLSINGKALKAKKLVVDHQ